MSANIRYTLHVLYVYAKIYGNYKVVFFDTDRFREFCYRVVSSQAFSTITYVAVLISSLILTIEVPIGVPRDGGSFCAVQVRTSLVSPLRLCVASKGRFMNMMQYKL